MPINEFCRGCGKWDCVCKTLISLDDAPREMLVKAIRELGEEATAAQGIYEWTLASLGLKD